MSNIKHNKVHRRINRDHWPIQQALELEEHHHDTN